MLILGATGMVGALLLDRLLADPGVRRVDVLARRPTGRTHPRLREHRTPLDRLVEHAPLFAVETVFCALGTTLRAAGGREAFRRVDHDAVAAAASLAAAAGAARFLLVSASGANAASRIFYNRVKGEAEAAVAASGVPAIGILRPSLLLGRREEARPVEALARAVLGAAAPLMAGPLRRVRPVAASAVAAAMHRLGEMAWRGVRIVENEEIFTLADDA